MAEQQDAKVSVMVSRLEVVLDDSRAQFDIVIDGVYTGALTVDNGERAELLAETLVAGGAAVFDTRRTQAPVEPV